MEILSFDFLRNKRNYHLLVTFVLQLAIPCFADNHVANSNTKPAPGYQALNFPAPTPGTYQLPKLGLAANGDVLNSSGETTTLHQLMKPDNQTGKVNLLSFIYTSCSDVNGCPLATAVFHKIKSRLGKEPEIVRQLRLLTLSFNPIYDTPERMKAYGKNFQGDGIDWQFLTTKSEQELQPILKNYQQPIDKVFDAKGHFTNTFNHSLRVYLIDQNQQIRNIYNTELLHPDMVIADVQTLLIEQKGINNQIYKITTKLSASSKFNAGDNKSGYESKAYQTQSVSMTERIGKAADLLKTIKQPPLGLPKVTVPTDNPITLAKANLGRLLFYDRRLSLNNTFSCAMCHIPEQGFTSNEMATAVGVEGRSVRRNSPTLYNVAYQKTLFHDSRESTLEQQVWAPLLAHNEMANPSIGYVIDKIKQMPDYAGLFEQAFGKPANMEMIGMAIASYERTLNSANSAFDRRYYGKDDNAITKEAQRGYQLFIGKANCSQCHQIGKDDALFTDNKLHNTGIGYQAAMSKTSDNQKVQVAPGVYVDAPSSIVASVSEPKANDLGRYEITQNPKDRWRYKTPTLRNINLTAPYMHDGSLTTLREVIEFYNRGGIPNESFDPLIKPLQLSKSEMNDLVAFLESLTGDNVNELVSDAFAAPVGN